MKKVENIILHCSDSPFGNAFVIDLWHRGRGWSGIGYHLVVLNGYPTAANWKNRDKILSLDGSVETGRYCDFDELVNKDEVGAHALGYNARSIGICFILQGGVVGISERQFDKGIEVVFELIRKYSLTEKDVLGHREVTTGKTCPDFDVDLFRSILKTKLSKEAMLDEEMDFEGVPRF